MSDIKQILNVLILCESLKYIHSLKDALSHYTRLLDRGMEQSHLSPCEYISLFTLIDS